MILGDDAIFKSKVSSYGSDCVSSVLYSVEQEMGELITKNDAFTGKHRYLYFTNHHSYSHLVFSLQL